MNFFDQFGIQPILLLAQVVNFFILLFILNKFLYKPILKVLEQRKQTIADSLKNAEKIEQELIKTEEQRQKKLDQALSEAKTIIAEAKQASSTLIDEARLQAATEAQKVLDQGRKDLTTERDQLRQEIKTELADLVVASLEKIAQKELSKTDRQRITKETISNLK